MAKYGSADVAFFLIDGYNVLGDTMEIDMLDSEALFEETHTLGDSWTENTPVGLRKATLSQKAFWDSANNTLSHLIADNEETQRTITIGLTSSKSVSFQGAFAAKFLRKIDRGKLHKVDVKYTITGSMDEGLTIQPLQTKVADWTSTANNNVTSSILGASAYQQVTAMSGFTGFVGKFRHSSDDVTYADLISFTNVTSAPNAQRKTFAAGGTINKYVKFSGDVTGSGSITVTASFTRYR